MTKSKQIQSLEFSYDIAWTCNYGELFRGNYTEITDIDRILERVTECGRTLLSGKGGSGKTNIVHRVMRAAQEQNFVIVFVDMRQWSPQLQDLWEMLDDDPLIRANFLLVHFGDPPLSLSAIDEFDPGRWKLVVVDGLNEVRSTIGQQVVAAADRLAATFSNLCVLTTDRLVRREIEENRWALGLVLPLKEEIAQEILNSVLGQDAWELATVGQRHMLEIPFFLDKVLHDGQITSTTAEVIGDYLERHAGLSDIEIDAAAQGAFNTYCAGYGGRSFPRDAFVKDTGAEVARRLEQSGVLRHIDETSYFDHHLFHDYLAARYLSKHPKKWEEDSFDAMSFNASSFDAISKVLELIDASQADNFIRKVYDWNPYAASYAMSETVSSDRRVSEEMEHVIAAMLAERRWDVVRPTAVRAEDALAILGTDQARKYLRAKSPEEVLGAVGAIKGEKEWFRDWQQLYIRRPHKKVQNQELELLEARDSILGWTATNVFRRLKLTNEQLRCVRQLAGSSKFGTVRWRAVHVLGAFPSKVNKAVLFERLGKDRYTWVRYGALRSLMEMAARSAALRSQILEALSRQGDLLAGNELLRSEFSRAADATVDKAEVESWMSGIGRVIRALADRAEDERDLEHWARLSRELGERYAARS